MNSTSATVKRIFFKELMPLADKLRSDNRRFFLTSAEPNVGTYYRQREKTTVNAQALEVAGCDSVDNLEKALTEMWTAQGYPELVALAPALSKLAKSLYLTEKQEEDVSPFIYVMF